MKRRRRGRRRNLDGKRNGSWVLDTESEREK